MKMLYYLLQILYVIFICQYKNRKCGVDRQGDLTCVHEAQECWEDRLAFRFLH